MSRRLLAIATTSLLASGMLAGPAAAPASAAPGVPAVSSTEYPADSAPHRGIGASGNFTLTGSSADTVEYAYRFTGGELGTDRPWVNVPARTPGAPVTINWMPFYSGVHELSVYAIDGAGDHSGTTSYRFWVRDTRPKTTSKDYPGIFFHDLAFNVGVPGEFRIDGPAGVDHLDWRIDDDGPTGSAPVNADGDAVVKIAPTKGGIQTLFARAVEADGYKYPEHPYRFLADDGPIIVGDNHIPFIGAELSFHVTPRVPGVKSYEYWVYFDLGPQPEIVTVPAKADGTADFGFTVTGSKQYDLYVRSIDENGVRSVARANRLPVDAAAPAITRTGGDDRGSRASFVARTEMPDATEYTVQFNGDPATKRVVKPVGGSARFDFTPTAGGKNSLEIWATRDGIRTASAHYAWQVSTVRRVSSVSPSTVTTGGVRTITLKGANLDRRDVLQVTPAGAKAVTATVKAVSADGTTATADVNLAGAPAGVAAVTLRPYGASQPALTLARAFTIALQAKPQATKRPAISGTVAVGNAVKAAAGTWSPAATGYRYQWVANGAAIKGATGSSFTIPASVAGKRLTVIVTATRAGHHPGSAVSAATAPVAKGKAPKATKKPKVTGTAKVGKKLTANAGTWSPKVDSYRYEWRVNGKLIKGASARTLKLKSVWRGKKITVTVIAKKAGYADGRATSASVKVR